MDLIQSLNVRVSEFDNKPVYIRTHLIEPGDTTDKPVLVLVHGYAASGTLYYQIFKRLSERFHVIVTDLIGMGASSRPKDYQKNKITPQESIDYFVEYFEKWRKSFSRLAKKKLTKFILVGHSFGGYICGNYTLNYPEHVQKLILISPIGLRIQEEGEKAIERTMAKMKEAQNTYGKQPPAWAKAMLKYAWKKKITPFQVARGFGQRWCKMQIDAYLTRTSDGKDQMMTDHEK